MSVELKRVQYCTQEEYVPSWKETKEDGSRPPTRSGRATDRTPAERLQAAEELRPVHIGITHQDSCFTNSFQAKPYYVVHPEWISESIDDPTPKPLDRPPWPWEQPRYRVNMQAPHTYSIPQKNPAEEAKQAEELYDYSSEVPPLSYQLTQQYRSTHPQYVMRY